MIVDGKRHLNYDLYKVKGSMSYRISEKKRVGDLSYTGWTRDPECWTLTVGDVHGHLRGERAWVSKCKDGWLCSIGFGEKEVSLGDLYRTYLDAIKAADLAFVAWLRADNIACHRRVELSDEERENLYRESKEREEQEEKEHLALAKEKGITYPITLGQRKILPGLSETAWYPTAHGGWSMEFRSVMVAQAIPEKDGDWTVTGTYHLRGHWDYAGSGRFATLEKAFEASDKEFVQGEYLAGVLSSLGAPIDSRAPSGAI